MKSFLNIITYDYLQRTRSYGFLITLCVSLAMGYSFVPEPNANYSTIRIGEYLGFYNSAWFGYVTAIMASIFLSLIGFYLVNSGIKTDVDTRVGQIMAATPIKNRTYLVSKTLSNFLVLLTIVLLIFLMSILLFFIYHDAGFSLEIWQFIKPYLLITIPSIFFVSAIAVLAEMFLGRYSIVQYVSYFFLYIALMVVTSAKNDSNFMFDVFGTQIVIQQMEEQLSDYTGNKEQKNLNIGYVIGNMAESKKFDFKGVDFPPLFILSRILWILLSLFLVIGLAPFFHRFNFRQPFKLKKTKTVAVHQSNAGHISLSNLPSPQIDYGIITLLKTEILLLFRQGKKWLWLVNAMGLVFLSFLSMETAHQIVLPVLWFLQVGRLSNLTSKEIFHGVHYLSFSSYRPLTRLLLSQILAASLLMVLLATPLIIRYAIDGYFIPISSIILGGIGIVLFAAVLGILSKGKKLFEILFFMISYANINGIPFLDYFGAINQDIHYVFTMLLMVMGLGIAGFLLRNYQLQQ